MIEVPSQPGSTMPGRELLDGMLPETVEVGSSDRLGLLQLLDGAMTVAVEHGSSERQWLLNFVGRAVQRGASALEMERSKPAVDAALHAVFPGNGLIRLEDYDIPGRKWKNKTLSTYVGAEYARDLVSPIDTGGCAYIVDQAVEQWFEYFSGAPLSSRADGWQESDSDWRHMAKRLRQPNAELLRSFGSALDAKITREKELVPIKRDVIQSQQTLLPYALLQIAYRAYLEGNPDKAETFIEDFATALGDNANQAELLRAMPFESKSARQAFGAAVAAYDECCLTGSDKHRAAFFTNLIQQSMAMHMITNAQAGAGFGLNIKSLYEGAVEVTDAVIANLDFEDEVITSIFTQFGKEFRAQFPAGETKIASQADTRAKLLRMLNGIMARRTEFLIQLQGIQIARGLTSGLIDEKFSVTELHKLASLATEKPLGELAQRVEEVNEMFELWEVMWQVAPPHHGLLGSRDESTQPEIPNPKSRETEVEFDATEGNARYEWLKTYMRMWNRGRCVLVRSKIPNLLPEQQYHVALFSEDGPDGEVIWHGMADNVDNQHIGEHAVLVWRAEAGFDEYGRRKFNWDNAYRLHKDEMKLMHMYRLLHTDTLRNRLLQLVFYKDGSQIPPYSAENYAEVLRRQVKRRNAGNTNQRQDAT